MARNSFGSTRTYGYDHQNQPMQRTVWEQLPSTGTGTRLEGESSVERSAGRDQEAESNFQRALSLDGRLRIAFDCLLDLYVRGGRDSDAKALLARYPCRSLQ